MELTNEEVDSIINKISSGKDFIYVDLRADFIVLKYPSNELKQLSEVVYDRAYSDAIKEGLLPLKDLEDLLDKRGIFTEDDQANIDKLKSKLDAQNILLSKTLKVKANQDRIKATIVNLDSQIAEIIYKKHSKLIMSAESKSEEYKNQYLCWASSTDLDGRKIWPTFKDFMTDTEFELKNLLLPKFIKLLNGIPASSIRFVARSTLWRIRYANSIKTSEALFGVPAASYTLDQLNLSYWSNFYDNIYSMMPEDKPSDNIIDDDESLDVFMDDYYKELSNEAASRKSNKAITKGAMSAFDAEEVIVTQSNALYHDIEYDKPREAHKVKDRSDLRKRTR